MTNRWYRYWDFNKKSKSDSTCTNIVGYRSIYSTLIKEVEVLLYSDGDALLSFKIPYRSINKVNAIFQQFCMPNEFNDPMQGVLHISIKPHALESTLKKLIALFQYMRREYGQHEISLELMEEFQRIFHCISSHEKMTHLIPDKNVASAHINPARSTSTALIDFLRYRRANAPFDKQFDSLLIQGENPNQCDFLGDTPITLAIFRDIEYLKRLIIMGANFLQRPEVTGPVFFTDAMELAEKHKKTGHLDIMASRLTTIEKPISGPVTRNDLMMHHNQIVTTFHFKNKQPIFTRLKKTTELSKNEKQELFNLFSQFFELTHANHPNELKDLFFKEDLKGQNKFVELIHCGAKVIGFNLFEILESKTDPRYLFLHCAYALIQPQYRGYGLMSLLAFRLAYCLQQLAPERKVGVLFFSNHFNSYKMLMPKDISDNAFLNFPMYQSTHVVQLVKEFVDFLYEGKAKLHHDNFACYIKEKKPLKVSGSYHSKHPDIYEDFFYKDIQGHDADFSDGPHVTPVVFLVEDHSFKKLSRLCSSLGIHFGDHINKLSTLVSPFLQQYTGLNQANKKTLSKNNYLFWFNESIASDTNSSEHSTTLRSCL
jgi:hypothetical protein